MDKYDVAMLALNAYWKYKKEYETENHIQKRNSSRRRGPKGYSQ